MTKRNPKHNKRKFSKGIMKKTKKPMRFKTCNTCRYWDGGCLQGSFCPIYDTSLTLEGKPLE